MNFRILAASARPRGRIFALLAATALSAALLVPAEAQQPAAPGTGACARGAEGRPQGGPEGRPQGGSGARPPPSRRRRRPASGAPRPRRRSSRRNSRLQLIYAPWTKFCLKGQEANAKQVCFTGKDGRIESGQPVIAAVIIEPEGEPKKILRVTLPLGMQLVHGTRIIVDSNPPQQSPYVICFPNGCMSDYEATAGNARPAEEGRRTWWCRRSIPTAHR